MNIESKKINFKRKTKIVSTLGPATNTSEKIEALINAGVNVFRFNFSHGTYDEHYDLLKKVRSASDKLGIPVAALQDLSGPKIRIRAIDESNKTLVTGEFVNLHSSSDKESDINDIYVELVKPHEVLSAGHRILLSDGKFELETIEVFKDKKYAKCKILAGGDLRSNIGVTFPDSVVDLPATTEKDLEDFKWGLNNELQFDYTAVSFIQKGSDLERLRIIAKESNYTAKIIAKIEMKAALENLDSILEASDGIMVARGDLGVELPIEKVPLIQKELIAQANFLGMPVIVATQMLHSMVKSLRPTRAEASDVATAVMTGADAVMLSEETAIGDHPIEAVEYLGKIAREAEKSFTFEEYKLRLRDADKETIPDAIAYAVTAASIKVNASAIIACTETGYSARLIAKYRPQQLLYGISSRMKTIRRMCLYWGVQPIFCESSDTHFDEVEAALKKVQALEKLPNGSIAAITGGRSVRTPGSTSVIEIREMNYKD
ncbi:UNVERIFIED_CONTAM: hypothetical protein GTU68_056321 [Idotea baltica]|nr:hypothetical protein [Idotea baltica]